jgi:hypothetical protein
MFVRAIVQNTRTNNNVAFYASEAVDHHGLELLIADVRLNTGNIDALTVNAPYPSYREKADRRVVL